MMREESEYERLLQLFLEGEYHKPIFCAVCGGTMLFNGVGEYICEQCHSVDYDDYGKVRLYIESHEGASIFTVAEKTGVDLRIIRHMMRNGLIEGYSL